MERERESVKSTLSEIASVETIGLLPEETLTIECVSSGSALKIEALGNSRIAVYVNDKLRAVVRVSR
jgi:hypothetical protein